MVTIFFNNIHYIYLGLAKKQAKYKSNPQFSDCFCTNQNDLYKNETLQLEIFEVQNSKITN